MSNVQSRLESVSQNGYNYRLGDYISQGFSLFGKNAGMFIGYVVIYSVISFGLAIIPLLGQITSLLISSTLTAGFYIVAHQTFENKHTEFSNFFDGFKQWSQLFVVGLLGALLVILAMIPAIVYIISAIGFSGLAEAGEYDGALSLMAGVNLLIFFILILFGAIVAILFVYAPLFVLFDNLSPVDAIKASAKVVSKNILMHVLFGIVWGIILFISVLPLFLGLLVTVPAYFCSIYAAWRDITKYNSEDAKDDDEILRHLID